MMIYKKLVQSSATASEVSYSEVLVDKSVIDLILRVLDYIVSISFWYILYSVFICTVVVLNCFVMCGCVCMCGFCNVWCVCVGFVMCGCVYVCVLVHVYQHSSATLTEVFRAFSSVVRQMPG